MQSVFCDFEIEFLDFKICSRHQLVNTDYAMAWGPSLVKFLDELSNMHKSLLITSRSGTVLPLQ